MELRSWFQEGAEIFGCAHDLAVQAGGIDGALLLAWAGLFAFRLADYPRAQAVLERARVLLQTEHAPGVAALVFNNLGLVAYYAEALTLARVIEATRLLVEIQVGLARLAAREGNPTRAVELLAFALAHPAVGNEARESATRLLAELEGRLPPPEFDAAVTRGRALELETLVEQALAHNP